MPHINHIKQLCDTCVVTKLKRRPFPRQASYQVTEKLELVHSDLCSPMSLAMPRGCRYFLLLGDDTTRYMWAVLLDSKTAPNEECGHKLKMLQTDNDDEFTAADFAAYCFDEGVSTTTLCPTQCNRMAWSSAAIR